MSWLKKMRRRYGHILRKIIKGGTDRSYGIYVAKMAGLKQGD